MTAWLDWRVLGDKQFFVYILASRMGGTLYIGVTNNLPRRVWEHKQHLLRGFTQRYNVVLLVYYEAHATIGSAITREKQLKEWKRSWKIQLIEQTNPYWHDLYDELI
jgi:putative endonuclease